MRYGGNHLYQWRCQERQEPSGRRACPQEGRATPLRGHCPCGDAEMAARIARHQQRRGPAWQTVEEPYELLSVIAGHDGWFQAVLVDCITLWLTNLLLSCESSAIVLEKVRELATAAKTLHSPLILVSNEVGMGIVPDNALARQFRDLAGEANEILAAAADEVLRDVFRFAAEIKIKTGQSSKGTPFSL